MLQEPLLVVGAFYILFFTVIIYVRLDFAITKVRHICFYEGSLVSDGHLPPLADMHVSLVIQLFSLHLHVYVRYGLNLFFCHSSRTLQLRCV